MVTIPVVEKYFMQKGLQHSQVKEQSKCVWYARRGLLQSLSPIKSPFVIVNVCITGKVPWQNRHIILSPGFLVNSVQGKRKFTFYANFWYCEALSIVH